MPYKANIQWLDEGRILAECGPMRLVISAWRHEEPKRDSAVLAAYEGFRILERVARCRPLLSQLYESAPAPPAEPLAGEMIRSVQAIDSTLTPMAAVAGTIADGVADYLFGLGMTKVIVNNGGDIALRGVSGMSVNVGLRPDMNSSPMKSMLTLSGERTSWGVATSGLEGRSLSRGVASAATVIASTASLADAAATAVANASFVADDSVIQKQAYTLDKNTDIPNIYVTVQAGPLPESKRDIAISQALEKADQLIRKKLIHGAFVVVDGKEGMTDFVRERMIEL